MYCLGNERQRCSQHIKKVIHGFLMKTIIKLIDDIDSNACDVLSAYKNVNLTAVTMFCVAQLGSDQLLLVDTQ